MNRSFSNIVKIIIVVLLTGNLTISLANKSCKNFDQIALQLAFIQNNMEAPLSLENIELILGKKPPATTSTATYSWTHNNRALLVTTNQDNIINKILTGNDDGTIASKKMEQIYANLKSATSIWTIKDIQNQLGPGHVTKKKICHYNWHCGIGSLKVTTNQNNKIIASKTSYSSSLKAINDRLGHNHPRWDVETDSLGRSYRAWERKFAN